MKGWTRVLIGAVFGVACVSVVTAVIFGLREVAPILSLGTLYLFAVLPVAVVWGLRYALCVSVGSMLAFNFFFLPPRTHSRSTTPRTGSRSPCTSSRPWSSASSRRTPAPAAPSAGTEAAARGAAAALLQAEDVTSSRGSPTKRPARWERSEDGSSSTRAAGRAPTSRPLTAGGSATSEGSTSAAQPAPRRGGRLLPALARCSGSPSTATGCSQGARGRDLQPKRRGEDRRAPPVSHDLRSPLMAIRAAAESLPRRLALAEPDRERAAGDDARPRPSVSTGSSATCSTSRCSRRAAPAPRPRRGQSTTSSSRRWTRSAPSPSGWRLAASAIRRRQGRRAAGRADAGQPDRERAPVLAARAGPRHSRLHGATGRRARRRRRPGHLRERGGAGLRAVLRGRPPAVRGAGLGLAIARGFAEANGGHVCVESRPGEGANHVRDRAARRTGPGAGS